MAGITNRKKRLLSLLLSVVMIMTMLPSTLLTAFAAADDNLCEHHTEHTADCHYEEGVHECHYECAECAEAEATTEEETEGETTEAAPVCDCGTDDASVHATSCPAYVAPENPVCTCAEKCVEANVWCDVCGFDVTACQGMDTAAAYDTCDCIVKCTEDSVSGICSTCYASNADLGACTGKDPIAQMKLKLVDTNGVEITGSAELMLKYDDDITSGGGYKQYDAISNDSERTASRGLISGYYHSTWMYGPDGYDYPDSTVDENRLYFTCDENGNVTVTEKGNGYNDVTVEVNDAGITYLVLKVPTIDTSARINDLSITVDGVTYTSGNVAITPTTSTIVLNISGVYFANMNNSNYVWYAKGCNELIVPSGTVVIDTAANTATIYLSDRINDFAKCENFEIRYTNDGMSTWIGTGIYLTYCSEHSGGTQTCMGYECETCGSWYGEADPDAHSTTAEGDIVPTCSSAGYCTLCESEYTVDHSYTNGFCSCGAYEAATLNASGYYEIYNAGQLYWFAEQVNGGENAINAILMDNITVNEGVLDADGNLVSDTSALRQWTPLGHYNSADDYYSFDGIFDGNNKTISGLYHNDSVTL